MFKGPSLALTEEGDEEAEETAAAEAPAVQAAPDTRALTEDLKGLLNIS